MWVMQEWGKQRGMVSLSLNDLFTKQSDSDLEFNTLNQSVRNSLQLSGFEEKLLTIYTSVGLTQNYCMA